jgi:molybdopterin synthase sulfur carrier subunit
MFAMRTCICRVSYPQPMETAGAQVHLFAAARAAVGAQEVSIPAGSLLGVLDRLVADYPEFAAVRPRCSYLIDGVAVHGDLAEIQVEDGARVDVLPPFAGG